MKVVLILIILLVIFLPLIFILIIVRNVTKDDDEFPGSNGPINDYSKWPNLYLFKKIAYILAEKDEEIKNYLLDCKNKHDSHVANIHGSNVDRKTDSQDISSDIQ